MNVAELARKRYTCKAYDPQRNIAPELIAQLQTLLRYAPSSVNSQPWHFIFAASDEAKARIAKATENPIYAANGPRIRNASHVVVFCAPTTFDDARIERITEQEVRDGRWTTEDAKATQLKSRRFYFHRHRFDLRDLQPWMERQVYIALGMLLFGAAALGIDATPIEGFDTAVLNDELGLRERGLTAVVLAALGYRSDADFNAKLPKSRLPAEEVISEI